jgi:eukaryotic-like serine/threonine-protein kinase
MSNLEIGMSDQPGIDEIFCGAIEIESPDERECYLNRVCGEDVGLRKQVDRLLAAHFRGGSLIDSPRHAMLPTFDQQVSEGPGTQIGSYKLLEQIGEGGFGVVYMAEQHQPVRRKVALKVLKPGMDTRQIVARFEAERQALALMDHPNIARVFDGGTASSGRPYFVMELVKGVPITEYCDHRRLTPRQRLELFLSVCHAVQHAHQKGIIHRDIKPTNVLVTMHDTVPVLKVIDFGVAKALGQELTSKTLFTGFTEMIGTPLYMSPEQAGQSGLDIDTRSDVYSLGVLLYELLTGTTPFEKSRLQQAAYDEIRRIICEEEPPRPSMRLSSQHKCSSQDHRHSPHASNGVSERALRSATPILTSIAAARSFEYARLIQLTHGELDWIVMKALEKDRNRRYESASSFAADVQRYLAGDPVLACPPSLWYRVHKFARRHKSPMLAAGLAFLALVCGVIGTTWGLIQAREQRAVVERQRNELAERNEALQVAHERERLVNARARQAIETVLSDQAVDRLSREKRLSPEQEEFLDTMIQYYAESVEEGTAIDLERAWQARAYHRMGRLNQILGRSQASENAYRRALNLGHQLAADYPSQHEFRKELALTYNVLGVLLRATRSREAEAAYSEALALLMQLVSDFPDQYEFRQAQAGIYNNLGNLFGETGRLKEAEDAHAEALAIRKQLAADFPSGINIRRALAMSHSNLGWIFQTTERLPESEAAYRDAVAFQREHLAEYPNQPEFRLELAKYLFHLGNVLRDTGRPEDAKQTRAEAVAIFKQLVADFPSRPEFRQEMTDRGLQEDRGDDDRVEELPPVGLDTPELPNQ